jgi:hypothetical protein
VTIERALGTWASVVDADLHRNVAESIVPGVLLHYDLDDLMIAIAPRRISVVHSVSGNGSPVNEADFHRQLARVFQVDQALGFNGRVAYAAEPPSQLSAAK